MTLSFAPERIETWPLSRLQPYAKNAKVHGADQVAKIAASMAEFGWTVPCLVAEDGELIAGHGRVLAATQLGLTEAPVIVLGHLTEAQRRAYRIADNKLTELGSWDEPEDGRGIHGGEHRAVFRASAAVRSNPGARNTMRDRRPMRDGGIETGVVRGVSPAAGCTPARGHQSSRRPLRDRAFS